MNIAITFLYGIGRKIGDEKYLIILNGFICLASNMNSKLD